MGGGDLNMKKSWHPLLMKNQERVWLEEKKALEEKKKLDQLRKEKEEERQLQELQRLQEEQTGKKRSDKLEWMYATPATGSSQNPNDLEDYLLGKKRVDKMLIGEENKQVGAAHKNFIAVQNANNVRDTAAKIREDPLFAIKQQEQAAYQALMSNPLRLKEMQERNGIKPKKEKKKDKKHSKTGKERLRSASLTPDRTNERRLIRDRSPDHRRRSLSRDRYSRTRIPSDLYDRPPRPSLGSPPRRSRSPDIRRHRYDTRSHSPDDRARKEKFLSSRSRRSPDKEQVRVYPRSDESDENPYENPRGRNRSRTPDDSGRIQPSEFTRKRSRSPDGHPFNNGKRFRTSPPPPPKTSSKAAEDRAARLAAMSDNASSLIKDRSKRLTALLAQEKAEFEAEERARAKSKGMGGFLNTEQKKVFSGEGGLEDRIRRGRGGIVAETD